MFKFLKEYWQLERDFRYMRSYRKRLAVSSDLMSHLELQVIDKLCGRPGTSGEHLEFRRSFYNSLEPDQKQLVKSILLKILRSDSSWLRTFSAATAYVCADIEMDEAIPEIRRMTTNPRYALDRSSLERVLRFSQLELPNQLKFIFTELYHRKSREDLHLFVKRYSLLSPSDQTGIKEYLLRLIRDEDIVFGLRALQVYAEIDREGAKQRAAELVHDPRWKDYSAYLISLQEI